VAKKQALIFYFAETLQTQKQLKIKPELAIFANLC